MAERSAEKASSTPTPLRGNALAAHTQTLLGNKAPEEAPTSKD
jgi:hypothetical protein